MRDPETIRVLHVVPGLAPQQGGVAVNVLGIARAAKSSGNIINCVYTLDSREPASARTQTRITYAELAPFLAGLDVELFRARRPYRVMYSPDLRRGLERTVRDFDVVHIHSLFLYPQAAAFRVASRFDKPYIVTLHGSLDPALRHRNRRAKWLADRLWQRRMLDQAALLHFTTEAERELVADLGFQSPSVVVPNGIHWDAFQMPGQANHRRDSDARTILYLGRLSHKKGLDLLLRAFALARRDASNVKLVIAGPDDENLSGHLTALADELGVRKDTEFPGYLSGEQRLRAFATATVSVLPSATENFGTTVIESMAAGVPVIISPQVNLAEDIRQAGAGVVCDRDPEVLAAEMTAILGDPARQDQLRTAGEAFARRYDWRHISPRLVEMYRMAAK